MDGHSKAYALNEQELYCIAKHIQYLVLKDFWEQSNVKDACCECKYVNNPCKLYCWGAFMGLARITGADIRPYS